MYVNLDSKNDATNQLTFAKAMMKCHRFSLTHNVVVSQCIHYCH